MPPATTKEIEVPRPPGPTGNWLTGTVRPLRADALGTLQAWQQTYGDAVRFRFYGPFFGFLFCHPEHNEHILLENNRNYRKRPNPSNDMLTLIVGNGLLTSDGDFWLRQRRLAQPAFHRRRLVAFAETMADATAAHLDRWGGDARESNAFDVSEEMVALTLEIAGKTLFSVDLTHDASAVGDAVTEVNRQFSDLSSHPLGFFIVRMPWLDRMRRFHRHMARLDHVVYEIIGERRHARQEGAGTSDDLLDMLMDARDESSGEAMTDAQLRDEVMTLLLAGHETTANALTWAFYLLALNPDVLERVEAEVDEVLAQRPPSFRDLGNLTHCTMVLQETLRLYPPAYALARTAVADDVVGGYRVDAGASITLSPYLTHRHPAFWEQPDHFDPERFRPERSTERHRYAYIPFGAGPRMCIGNNFAMTEGVLIMAMVAQRYRLALQPGHPVALEPLITLRPRYGIKMIATRRHRARPVDR